MEKPNSNLEDFVTKITQNVDRQVQAIEKQAQTMQDFMGYTHIRLHNQEASI